MKWVIANNHNELWCQVYNRGVGADRWLSPREINAWNSYDNKDAKPYTFILRRSAESFIRTQLTSSSDLKLGSTVMSTKEFNQRLADAKKEG